MEKCCICGQKYFGHGHNARPYAEGNCCTRCNARKVIPLRIRGTHKISRVKKTVEHQGIGGHQFICEFEVTPDEIDKKAMEGNPACLNFALRRNDFLPDFNKTCYYGKVYKGEDIMLGYVVCEDELEEVSGPDLLEMDVWM